MDYQDPLGLRIVGDAGGRWGKSGSHGASSNLVHTDQGMAYQYCNNRREEMRSGFVAFENI